MKQSANSFGRVKNISAGLRLGLKTIFADYKSKSTMFAVDAAVRCWYNRVYPTLTQNSENNPYFEAIVINHEAPSKIELVLGVKPLMDWNLPGKIAIHIPESEASTMYLPAKASFMSFTLVVSGTKVGKTDAVIHAASQVIEVAIVNGKVKAINLEVNIELPKDYLCMAYLQVGYLTTDGWLKENRWKPIVVAGSCYKA